MFFLHCGWPKTGTKSLQAALARRRQILQRSGTVYPGTLKRELVPGLDDGSHNGIVELLRALPESDRALDDLLRLLVAHRDCDVVVSCETFTTWLLESGSGETARRFFAAVREQTPVTCVWTLRRLDRFVSSLCLQLLSMGGRLIDPAVLMNAERIQTLFDGMRLVEECSNRAVYVRYEQSGEHNGDLLRAVGVPAQLRREIEREVAARDRLNPSLTRKQAIAVLEADALAARAGATLEKRALCDLFNAGGFEFADDTPVTLLDAETRLRIRDEALRYAAASGIAAYVRFFELDDDDDADSARSRLDPDCVTDEDLERLVRACGAARV